MCVIEARRRDGPKRLIREHSGNVVSRTYTYVVVHTHTSKQIYDNSARMICRNVFFRSSVVRVRFRNKDIILRNPNNGTDGSLQFSVEEKKKWKVNKQNLLANPRIIIAIIARQTTRYYVNV